MLLSSAIALAQKSGCVEQVPRESQGAFSAYETFKHEWNQLVCVFIFLTNESLFLRLVLKTPLPGKSTDAVHARFFSTFVSLFSDSVLWESYYELTLEAGKARELLQSLKRAGPAVAASAILPDLEHIERGLSRWKRQYSYTVPGKSHFWFGLVLKVLRGTDMMPIDDVSLFCAYCDFGYQYLLMYSFASASYMIINNTSSGELGETPTPSREMLNTLINILEPSKMLNYVPTTLTAEVVTAESHDDARLLRTSIEAIRHGSPDNTLFDTLGF
ncbi:hypothetical protein EDB81DRAFT_880244 [Dactylonectria macrodidyma]|uniref:Uncharacterized protein n=1 Tax=Dactylonectria macrodidyma TaxID=307937 RepID=A0A9P9JCV3_9HYPO|nr:hypothetical protein EDB81DRAFT_880244 [Dactylonectria macrodidyma]